MNRHLPSFTNNQQSLGGERFQPQENVCAADGLVSTWPCAFAQGCVILLRDTSASWSQLYQAHQWLASGDILFIDWICFVICYLAGDSNPLWKIWLNQRTIISQPANKSLSKSMMPLLHQPTIPTAVTLWPSRSMPQTPICESWAPRRGLSNRPPGSNLAQHGLSWYVSDIFHPPKVG